MQVDDITTKEPDPSISELQAIIAKQKLIIEQLEKRISDAGWEYERISREYNDSERYSRK